MSCLQWFLPLQVQAASPTLPSSSLTSKSPTSDGSQLAISTLGRRHPDRKKKPIKNLVSPRIITNFLVPVDTNGRFCPFIFLVSFNFHFSSFHSCVKLCTILKMFPVILDNWMLMWINFVIISLGMKRYSN